jgi:hypothetical protein
VNKRVDFELGLERVAPISVDLWSFLNQVIELFNFLCKGRDHFFAILFVNIDVALADLNLISSIRASLSLCENSHI